mgnify:CR=1 FL=1
MAKISLKEAFDEYISSMKTMSGIKAMTQKREKLGRELTKEERLSTIKEASSAVESILNNDSISGYEESFLNDLANKRTQMYYGDDEYLFVGMVDQYDSRVTMYPNNTHNGNVFTINDLFNVEQTNDPSKSFENFIEQKKKFQSFINNPNISIDTDIDTYFPWSQYKGADNNNKFFNNVNLNNENFDQILSEQYFQKSKNDINNIETDNIKLEDMLTQEEWANLTDDEIIEWATNNEELNQVMDLRAQARKGLGMDPIDPPQTGTPEIKNKFRGGKEKKTTKVEKQKAGRTKGKKLIKGKGKVTGKKFRIKDGKNLKQTIVGTAINSTVNAIEETAKEVAKETAEETIESTGKAAAVEHWKRENIVHPNQMSDMDLADLTDEEFEQMLSLANGDQEINEWTSRRQKAQAENIEKHMGDNSDRRYKRPTDINMPEYDYNVDPDTGDVKPIKTGQTRNIQIEDSPDYKRKLINSRNNLNTSGSLDDVFDWMKSHKIGIMDIGWNLFSTVGDYKNARRQGHSVVSSAVRAAGTFAVNEMLGFWGGMGLMAFKELPKLAIKGTELLYKENRKMNSAANNQAFGGAQFQDTQQLATMRQSGMEMAKMAQYNLQQTLMGNEATHLHR